MRFTDYRVTDNRLRAVITDDDKTKIPEYADQMSHFLLAEHQVRGLQMLLQSTYCIVECFGMFRDFEDLPSVDLSSFEPAKTVKNNLQKAKESANEWDEPALAKFIEKALYNHGFEMYYQPIYSVARKKFISAEALIRLHDPNHGFISPELFIPVAEKNGTIHKIGTFVMREVFRFIASKEFKALGLEYIEINLSVAQCMRKNLALEVLALMQEYGVRPDQINLELTETVETFAKAIVDKNLDTLGKNGVSFSLDDYGTGYSNISRINNVPFKLIKFDKSFADAVGSPKMAAILTNTVRMMKDMDMEIVVEGVEDEKTLKVFKDLKCDYIQGYYFSRPLPRSSFVEFIQRSSIAS